MVSRTSFALALVFVVSPLAACDDAPTRTWTPADHAQPPSLGAVPAPSPSEPSSPEVARARAGAALFRANCAGCHGNEGRGDGPEAPPVARPPDLTSPEIQGRLTDAAIGEAIRRGRGAMPPFGDRIPAAGIDALVAHVRALRVTAPPR